MVCSKANCAKLPISIVSSVRPWDWNLHRSRKAFKVIRCKFPKSFLTDRFAIRMKCCLCSCFELLDWNDEIHYAFCTNWLKNTEYQNTIDALAQPKHNKITLTDLTHWFVEIYQDEIWQDILTQGRSFNIYQDYILHFTFDFCLLTFDIRQCLIDMTWSWHDMIL